MLAIFYIVKGDYLMKKQNITYTGPLTGTIGEAKEMLKETNATELGAEFDPIQQVWSVDSVDTVEYDGVIGYKDS